MPYKFSNSQKLFQVQFSFNLFRHRFQNCFDGLFQLKIVASQELLRKSNYSPPPLVYKRRPHKNRYP